MNELNGRILSVKGLFFIYDETDLDIDVQRPDEIQFDLEGIPVLFKCNGSEPNLSYEINKEAENVSLGSYGELKIFDLTDFDFFGFLKDEDLLEMRKLYLDDEIGFRLIFSQSVLNMINWGDEFFLFKNLPEFLINENLHE
ncbi:TPA: hypothetical protein ACFP4U_000333 [Neisseria lactamica]|uniref:hypothetical protein n=1 Tax=Neisseria polysaccharea TaxID=489 RepID=UPI00272BF2A1|nr:hypothetical protein [Neisseria polysaccharea]